MQYDWYKDLVHVPYGLVSLEGAKLSTRTGNIIYAEDILKEAISRAMKAIQEKNPNLENKENAAKQVGVGAVIFHDLYNQRIKNIDFSWDDVLSFEGTTGPYVQYTYARAKSILRKCADIGSIVNKETMEVNDIAETMNWNVLTDDVTFTLVKILSGYEEAILGAAERCEPSIIARYVISLATAFNKFYHECPVLHAVREEKTARVLLINFVQAVIKDSCGLLGMECPEEM